MITIDEVYALINSQELRSKSKFIEAVVCKLEQELYCNPVCFAFKYGVSIPPEKLNEIRAKADSIVEAYEYKSTGCITASAPPPPPPPGNKTQS